MLEMIGITVYLVTMSSNFHHMMFVRKVRGVGRHSLHVGWEVVVCAMSVVEPRCLVVVVGGVVVCVRRVGGHIDCHSAVAERSACVGLKIP